MFEMMLTMMQTAQRGGAGSPPGAPPYYRPRYGGPAHAPDAPPYDPRAPYDPRQPPARPQTPSEQLRDAVSVVRSTFEVAREFGFGGERAEAAPPEDDDSPVRVIDMGKAKGVINRSDGTLRGFETVMANLPDIIRGVSDLRAEIIKERRENQQRVRPQQLPPGYVEVTEGYVPPEGFVAVPVDQIPPGAQAAQAAESPLPEPPREMPPPIAAEPERPKRAWGMPEVPR